MGEPFTPSPSLSAGVPEDTAVPVVPGAEPSPAPVDESPVKAFEERLAAMQAKIDAQSTAFLQALERFAPAAPQPQPAPQPQYKSFAEIINEANLPDPALARGPEYNAALAGALEAAFNTQLERALQPLASKFQSIEQERAQQQQTRQMVSEMKRVNPQLANVPDWQIESALGRINNDVALSAIAGTIQGLIQPQQNQITQSAPAARQTTLNQPGPASDLPAGMTSADLATLKSEYQNLVKPGGQFISQQMMATEAGQKRHFLLFDLAQKHGW